MEKLKELSALDLRKNCDPASFGYASTDEVSTEVSIIGQERALKAIDFGLGIDDEWYNLYIAGEMGTGRNTAIVNAVNAAAKKKPAPEDICYLYNFEKPGEPGYLKLPAGKGCEFQQDIESFIKELESEIRKTFSGEEYEKHRKTIVDQFEKLKEALDAELAEFAQSKGFILQETLTGFVVSPMQKGHKLTGPQYDKLSEEEKAQIKRSQDELENKVFDNSRKVRELQRELKRRLFELDEKIGLYAIGHLLDELKKKYAGFAPVVKHLEDIRNDVLKNLDLIKKEPEQAQPAFLANFSAREQENIFGKYKVNLLVDNCKSAGAPVVIESNPTFYNLVGYVEYRAQFGVLSTDFTMIKPGALLKANGGFLIVQANQILRDYFAWDALKKAIRYKKVKIENMAEQYGFVPTSGLKPEPVPVDLKVIVVGDPWIYYLLYIYDEDFRKYFRVKADFDSSLRKSDDFIHRYADLVAEKVKEEKLLPFRSAAVARIIDHSSRIMSHKEKLTTRFLDIVDIMKEADHWARSRKSEAVEAEHVNLALEEKIYRSNMIESKIRDMFEENTIFVDTEGKVCGQINGLSVINLGDYMFGMPSRITASTFMGKGNITNIEREAKMSGRIHSKGIMILSGYLGEKFCQDKPLALSASICFEQLYEEVEGDSASSAELYCLLSSLSGLPLRQDIAVTGSVNQKGMVQPIGGVNEKIEGFYGVCKVKGLTGTQGVLIPESNVKNLMLKDEVVEAVKNGKFHVYSVSTIEQGIELLTGVSAGETLADGKFTGGSVFYKVNEKLAGFARLAKEGENEEK